MAIIVKHSKVSAIPDDVDTSLVLPSDWNADHSLTGTIDIANGGTGQTTANAAFNALAPSQTGNTGKYLTTNGTDSSWSVNPLGTVTSVAATASTGISVTGSPITTSGTLIITNTAPDQTVAITSGTGISATGTYPNFTIANTGVTSAVAGTSISVSGATGAVTITNTSPDQVVVLSAGTGISTSGTYPNFTITNTSPSSGGTVTSVTGTSPVVSSGGNTPAISMPAATTSVNGYLTSTDWTTFNNKGSGTVTSVTATSPVTSTGGATPVIAMPAATTSVNGYLTSTDWTTFNNKGSGTVTSVAATVPSFLSVAGSPITTSGTLALTFSGTALPVANGGTGITSFGSGIATWLGTPSSANLASAVTDETGSGSLVFATSPSLTTPVLGTPSSGNLDSCTADGTNKVGYRNIPNSGAKTSSYTLVASDVGKFIELGTSGTVVVPASVFAAGDAISIFNNTGASISCTCSAITDFYKGGTDTDISTFSVTTRGVATILFITATRAVVTGNLA